MTKASEVDPFVHEFKLTAKDWIRIILMSLTFAPIRLLAVSCLFILASVLSGIGLIGVGDSDLATQPLTGWRKTLQSFILRKMGRAALFCLGFHTVTVKGSEQASSEEAPVLVAAPHSTVVDVCAVIVSGAVPLVKDIRNPLVRAIGSFQQVLFVDRLHKSKCMDIRQKIRSRALGNWPQLIIFPEATTTNGKAIIKFKTGAFQSGLPVQPVLIQHNICPDTITWTTYQHPSNFALLMWLTMCRLHSSIEIDFLPVYLPNESEQKNSKLFARNVRDLVARELGLPVSDRHAEDVLSDD